MTQSLFLKWLFGKLKIRWHLAISRRLESSTRNDCSIRQCSIHNKSKVRLALLGGELPLVVSSLGRLLLFTNDFPFDVFECSPTLNPPPNEVSFAITLLRIIFFFLIFLVTTYFWRHLFYLSSNLVSRLSTQLLLWIVFCSLLEGFYKLVKI